MIRIHSVLSVTISCLYVSTRPFIYLCIAMPGRMINVGEKKWEKKKETRKTDLDWLIRNSGAAINTAGEKKEPANN